MELANSKAKSKKRAYRNIDRSQVNKCTICNFTSHVKSNFQRHLMKLHGIKLKGLEQGITGHYAALGRVLNDYGISQNYSKKAVTEREIFDFDCDKCHKQFSTLRYLDFHKSHCNKILKAFKNNKPMYTCDQCGKNFLRLRNLSRHRIVCGKAKNIHCQLCPFKSLVLKTMQKHFIDLHNLICRAVEEPDFDQALNKTPYTLERAVEFKHLPNNKELDSLPEKQLLQQLTIIPSSKKYKKMFPCTICGHEFVKKRHLNQHTKYDKCYTKCFKSGK